MTTEQYSIGYEEGYQDGWNAAMEDNNEERLKRADIIRIAREAGLTDETFDRDWYVFQLERFAELVTLYEREACAKTAEDMCEYGKPYSAAAAIRARGNT